MFGLTNFNAICLKWLINVTSNLAYFFYNFKPMSCNLDDFIGTGNLEVPLLGQAGHLEHPAQVL